MAVKSSRIADTLIKNGVNVVLYDNTEKLLNNINNYELFSLNNAICENVIVFAPDSDICLKDYSNIFPGHGGILDRFDSLMYSSVIFLFFLTMAYNILPYMDIIAS